MQEFVIVEMQPANGVFPRVPFGTRLSGFMQDGRVVVQDGCGFLSSMKAVAPTGGRLDIRVDDGLRAPYASGRPIR